MCNNIKLNKIFRAIIFLSRFYDIIKAKKSEGRICLKKKKLLAQIKKLRWQNFPILLIAGIINAFGVTVFLSPVKLYDSGISGTSMLLSQVTPEYLTLSIFLIVLNVPLFCTD